MKNAKLVGTLLVAHFKLSADFFSCNDTKEEMSKIFHASTIGILMYFMVCTHPYIAHSVRVVSIFFSNLVKQHWQAVKWILRYLKGSSNCILCLGDNNIVLEGFMDADMTRDMDTINSTTGSLFTFAGATMSWVCRIQKVVALSIIESKYIPATKDFKEMLCMQQFL